MHNGEWNVRGKANKGIWAVKGHCLPQNVHICLPLQSAHPLSHMPVSPCPPTMEGEKRVEERRLRLRLGEHKAVLRLRLQQTESQTSVPTLPTTNVPVHPSNFNTKTQTMRQRHLHLQNAPKCQNRANAQCQNKNKNKRQRANGKNGKMQTKCKVLKETNAKNIHIIIIKRYVSLGELVQTRLELQ